MRGLYQVRVRSPRINYDFDIKRKITIIRGDSATGKTVLTSLLDQYSRGEYAIQWHCEAPCMLLPVNEWETALAQREGVIYFCDEDYPWILHARFVRAVNASRNYFVFITRDDLYQFSYSVDEVYRIKNSGKYNYLVPEFVRSLQVFHPTVVLTEDSNSGYAFFFELCKRIGIKCYSSGGKDNLLNRLSALHLTGEKILIVVDAAAYGPSSSLVGAYTARDSRNEYQIMAPESFEYMILVSRMFEERFWGSTELTSPEIHLADTHLSWEQYFFDLLSEATRNTPAQYSKSRLNLCYTADCCAKGSGCDFRAHGDKIGLMLGDQKNHFGNFHNDAPVV